MTNVHSAGPSALGYMAQVEYALLLVLRRMDDEINFDVSIETMDDIVFHSDGDVDELFQSKHRVNQMASLTDSSEDVWKTINTWLVEAPSGVSVNLVTNAIAPSNSAISKLRGGDDRDVRAAADGLATIARTSENQSTESSREAFLKLGDDGRRNFLSQITLVDGLPSVDNVMAHLELAVRKSTKSNYRIALIERLRGWWLQRVYEHLMRISSGEYDRISSLEVEGRLHAIAQHLRDDDLPIDFLNMPEPTVEEASEDERVFVHQLRLIALSSSRIRQCIYDHNRAFVQRSKWEREKLLQVGELGDYETRLKEAWIRYCLPETDAMGEDEEVIQREARERFIRFDQSSLPRIRAHVAAEYVSSGSLHILSDRMIIGWHPGWIQRLREILPDLNEQVDGAA